MPDPDERIRAFLAQTMKVWGIDACVTLIGPGVARIHVVRPALQLIVERAPPRDPFRWYLHEQRLEAGDAQSPRPRPCGSLVGLLRGLRRSLDIEPGEVVRVTRGGP